MPAITEFRTLSVTLAARLKHLAASIKGGHHGVLELE
jgi:hypothetical protein